MKLTGEEIKAHVGLIQECEEWKAAPIPPNWWYVEHATPFVYSMWEAMLRTEFEAGGEQA